MRKEIVFSNAVCKASETDLLGGDALTRLSGATFSDAVKMLNDYGFDAVGTEDIDMLIGREIKKLFGFITEYAPTKEAEDFLLAPYRFNNIKAEYKQKRGAPSVGMYDLPYSDLMRDKSVSEYLDKLYDNASPSEIDSELTKAMFAYKLKVAKKSGSKLLNEYCRAEIDAVNILTAIRAKKLNMAETVFIEGGNLSLNNLLSGEKPYDEFDLSDAVKLERQIDEYKLRLISDFSGEMDSLGPLMSYVTKKIIELKTVKMILVCLKCNAKDEISLRLRCEL